MDLIRNYLWTSDFQSKTRIKSSFYRFFFLVLLFCNWKWNSLHLGKSKLFCLAWMNWRLILCVNHNKKKKKPAKNYFKITIIFIEPQQCDQKNTKQSRRCAILSVLLFFIWHIFQLNIERKKKWTGASKYFLSAVLVNVKFLRALQHSTIHSVAFVAISIAIIVCINT